MTTAPADAQNRPLKSRSRRGRHEGGIRQRSNGLWEARISLGYDEAGKHIRRSVYASTKQELLDRMAEVRAAPTPRTAKTSRLTFAEFVPIWRTATTAEAKLRENTRVYYESHIRTHVLTTGLAGMQLARIRHPTIESLLANIKSDRSRQGTYEALTSLFRLATKRRLMNDNPMAGISKPKAVRRKAEPWSPEEAVRVLEAARTSHYYGVYALGLGVGLRRGEIFALRPRDVDLANKTVRVSRQLLEVAGRLWFDEPKTEDSARTIRISPIVVEALREAIALVPDHDALLFPDSEGGPVRRSNFDRRIHRPLLARAGVRYKSLHKMRHFQASVLLANREQLEEVSNRLGHSDTRVTLAIYSHLMPRGSERAAETVESVLNPTIRALSPSPHDGIERRSRRRSL